MQRVGLQLSTDSPLRDSRIQAGFTLAEMAIVLLIVVLLLGGLLMPLGAQIDQRNDAATNAALGEIREALIGYAATHTAGDGKPYLPCPDTDNDGAENRAGAVCASQEGSLPWVDLGVGQMDAWNNRFRYRVVAAYSRNNNGFTLTTPANLRACDAAGCAQVVANNLPAVILSHGRNGAGAVNASGAINAAPDATRLDELANTDANNDFVTHAPFATGSPGGEFDDVVTWLPVGLIAARLIAAGRLP